MSGPPVEAVPAGAAADYEAPRSGVLEGTRSDHDMGLTLLMRRGIAAGSGPGRPVRRHRWPLAGSRVDRRPRYQEGCVVM